MHSAVALRSELIIRETCPARAVVYRHHRFAPAVELAEANAILVIDRAGAADGGVGWWGVDLHDNLLSKGPLTHLDQQASRSADQH